AERGVRGRCDGRVRWSWSPSSTAAGAASALSGPGSAISGARAGQAAAWSEGAAGVAGAAGAAGVPGTCCSAAVDRATVDGAGADPQKRRTVPARTTPIDTGSRASDSATGSPLNSTDVTFSNGRSVQVVTRAPFITSGAAPRVVTVAFIAPRSNTV